MHSEAFGEPGRLVHSIAAADGLVDLLEGDDVRIEGRQDRGCPLEVEPTIHAATVLDVPGRDPEGFDP